MVLSIIIAALGVGGFLAFVASKPNRFRFERSTVISAPPEKIRPLIEDFRRWTVWSPWEKLDPDLKRTYGGAGQGVGATYGWTGNGKAGEGRMEIVEASADRTVVALDFLKPFKASNLAEFEYRPEGAATRLVWAMHGPQPFVGKLMHTVFNMDKMLGKDFEAGLASLKAAVEAS